MGCVTMLCLKVRVSLRRCIMSCTPRLFTVGAVTANGVSFHTALRLSMADRWFPLNGNFLSVLIHLKTRVCKTKSYISSVPPEFVTRFRCLSPLNRIWRRLPAVATWTISTSETPAMVEIHRWTESCCLEQRHNYSERCLWCLIILRSFYGILPFHVA